jgi:tetratricopeptide (TPR) repeat protein
MGQFRQSIESLSEGIRLAPGNPDAYFNRGTTYFQQGDYENACQDFSNVIRLTPGDEAAYFWRGTSHEAAGRKKEAIDDYRQFLALSSDQNARQEVEQRLRRWGEEKQDSAGGRIAAPGDRQKTSQKPGQDIDVYDLLAALGERALDSIWLGSDVDCSGEKAEQLYAYTEDDKPIAGYDLFEIASGVRQTRKGDFQAFDPGAQSPWIFIRAWEGTGFYLETNDPQTSERLKARLVSVEEVEGATPPYEGLFVRI